MLDREWMKKVSLEALYLWHQHRDRKVTELRAEMGEIDAEIAVREKAAFVPNLTIPAQGFDIGGHK